MEKRKAVFAVMGVAVVALLVVIAVLITSGKNNNQTGEDLNPLLQRISALEARLDQTGLAVENLKSSMVSREEFEKFTTDYRKRDTEIMFRITDIEAKVGITPVSHEGEPGEKAQKTEPKEQQAPSVEKKPGTKQQPPASASSPKPEDSKVVHKVQPPAAYYIVQKGDTAYSISRKFGLTVEDLLKMNGLASPTIYPGQKLKVK